jgi:hypothetical protein
MASSQEGKLKAQQRPTYCAPMACIFGEHETDKKVRPPSRTMPDDGTRVVYRTVISTYPGMMPDSIALGMLKQYWVVVLLGLRHADWLLDCPLIGEDPKCPAK